MTRLIQSDLEKIAIGREFLQNLDSLPRELLLELKEGAIEELERQQVKHEDTKKQVYISNARQRVLEKEVRKRMTLDDMPETERNRIVEFIYAKKLNRISKMIAKIADNVLEKGYFDGTDLKFQQECILAAEAFARLIEPLNDDRHAQATWRDNFESIVKRLKHDWHWSEEPDFVREHRYQIYNDGEIKDQYEYTNSSIIGPSIINKLNNIVFISDNIPFLATLFENNKRTRHKQDVKKRKTISKKRKQQ